jgi:membrane fusion protein (multidrug efflux system)
MASFKSLQSRLGIALVVVTILGVAGFFTWRYFSVRETTDDAQVSGHVSAVSARVSGPIRAIKIVDNQPVKAGDVLVELESRDYEIAVARAEADLASADANARAARNSVPVTSAAAKGDQHIAEAGSRGAEASLQAAEREVEAATARIGSAKARLAEVKANAAKADQDLERLRPLVAKDQIPRQQFDAVTSIAVTAHASVDSAEASVREAQANLDVAVARKAQVSAALLQAQAQSTAAATAPQQIALSEARASVAEAEVLQKHAALDQAKLNLERTIVRAPAAGIVSRRSLEVGQVVQAGQPLLAITTLDDVWVTANFKETQLRDMRPGQKVEIRVDARGGHEYIGHVESIAAATGATFSLLPADNATGNFVKVVQRVPVKIVLDPVSDGMVLRPGMSVEATVFIR